LESGFLGHPSEPTIDQAGSHGDFSIFLQTVASLERGLNRADRSGAQDGAFKTEGHQKVSTVGDPDPEV
jgi:hypothetical protein